LAVSVIVTVRAGSTEADRVVVVVTVVCNGSSRGVTTMRSRNSWTVARFVMVRVC